MAVLITAKNVTVEYPSKKVLDGVTFGINTGDRIGIVGQNGTGKSSLLKAVCGSLLPDAGTILKSGTPTIGMLGQTDSFSSDDVVADLLTRKDGIPFEADPTARNIANSLLDGIDIQERVGNLSGGQRRRVDLAVLLMGNWDILLLDEPTNHLDLLAINWLANHLKSRWQKNQGALLVVTHDRWFLDEVCTSMWELHEGAILPFEGGYSAYVMQRVERARLEEVARQKRENMLRRELAWLSRGAQARRSKPKFHLEQAAALIEDVPPLRNSIDLKNVAMARLGKQVIELQDVTVSQGGTVLFEDVSWFVGAGDRIGILGQNGVGKTTFLKLLSGQISPDTGRIKIGKTVRIGYLTQNLDELIPVENDVVRVVCSRYKTFYEVDGKLLSPTALLERLGFSRDDLNSRCKDLSGGQRRRLQFLLTLLEEPNVLILDEPGNDLDTDMLAAMEDLLDSWPGTLFIVSHDRYLLERTTDDQYAIISRKIRHMPGGVDEYLATIAHNNSATPQRAENSNNNLAQTQTSNTTNSAKPNLTSKDTYALKKKLGSLERKIATQETRCKEARNALEEADPYNYEELSEKQRAVEEELAKLAALEDEWLEMSDALQ